MPADRLIHPRCGKSSKVTMLTDLEFRVWVQYLLAADDFGVMHATAVELQSKNLHLAGRAAKLLLRCLDTLATRGLVRRFEHQGQPFLFQTDWQTWQKIEYPRATDNPKPDDLSGCDMATSALFEKHPGGQRKSQKRPEDDPNHLERASQMYPEGVPTTRASAPAKRLTANGVRLTANGLEGSLRETSFLPDRAFAEFVEAYPGQGRCANHLAMTAFCDVLLADPGVPHPVAFHALLQRLEGHKRSHQWRVKTMIPRLDRYLREGLHLQELPEHPPSTLVNEKSTRTLVSGEAFVKAGE